MRVGIVKYNAGNSFSVQNALTRLGVESFVSDEGASLLSADKIIFPGVGEASSAMRYLRERKLDVVIGSFSQPVLGVCLGMQLLCKWSEENDTTCIGIFPEEVIKIPRSSSDDSDKANLKVPHIGWNTLSECKGELFQGVRKGDFVYFDHGYAVSTGSHTSAITEHGMRFSAGLEKENFFGLQFHPEKSGTVGEQILSNFLDL